MGAVSSTEVRRRIKAARIRMTDNAPQLYKHVNESGAISGLSNK